MSNLPRIVEKFSGLRVLVIGEAILDRYLYGYANRFCQETPVPVVTLSHCENQPGGAANTAVNLRSLGTQVSLLSVIGNDEEGRLLQRALLDYQIDIDPMLVARDRTTLTKQRVMNEERLLLRFDQGTTNNITASLEHEIIRYLTHHFYDYDAVIVSDYGYGILTSGVIDAIATLRNVEPTSPHFQRSKTLSKTTLSKTLVVDAKALEHYKTLNVTAVKPNYEQVTQLLPQTSSERDLSRVDWIIAQTAQILAATGAQMVAVTLDQEGAVILQPQTSPHRIYANPVCPTRTIGAGDTFTATLAIALAAGASPTDAAELAAAAAALVVSKIGTSICTAEELQAHLSSAVHSA
ncbi:MAG: bifunctional hydroxymethylpyrimidine kinase/phosphomethylpyrimidine kinase [Myxacorys chilensis ATA2-1-KO14]|jgi:D-beta-D-heptose 7-phosphate kinase/D-beta-D-heptose 1-phosphate adenosyltransferase|nr:bifunctional hydroxymethylpyrimidine kinase/phosphomethylpyrimidine kinase [Myxacorys chilensis ATA2-1-KO14]